MTYTFNLIDQKWIPSIHTNGTPLDLSLRETILRAHELRSIQGDSPLEIAAIYRLLLAVLHSALRGPRTKSQWTQLWNRGLWEPEVISNYLDQWHDRFDLFDSERPFFQAHDERVKPKPINNLVMDMTQGNMATLFDHHTDTSGDLLTPAQAARDLLVMSYFGLAGLSGLEQKFTDASWARGIIFLIEGDTVFETLALNLLPYPSDILPSSSQDCPAWENPNPHLPYRQIPYGYLDYLTWQNRRILLIPEGDETNPVVTKLTLAPSLRLDAGFLDPMKLYRAAKESGYFVVRFTENRALWRDSASLFRLRNPQGFRPPSVFTWLAILVESDIIPRQKSYGFMGLGMANDQAKIDFFREEHLPLPLSYLEQDELVEQLSTALEMAEQCRFWLNSATQWLALLMISPHSDGKKWPEIDKISKEEAAQLMEHWNPERLYWQQLEVPFLYFLEKLPSAPDAMSEWLTTIQEAAWTAMDFATRSAGEDAIALKAAVRARSRLRYSLAQLPSTNKQEATT